MDIGDWIGAGLMIGLIVGIIVACVLAVIFMRRDDARWAREEEERQETERPKVKPGAYFTSRDGDVAEVVKVKLKAVTYRIPPEGGKNRTLSMGSFLSEYRYLAGPEEEEDTNVSEEVDSDE